MKGVLDPNKLVLNCYRAVNRPFFLVLCRVYLLLEFNFSFPISEPYLKLSANSCSATRLNEGVCTSMVKLLFSTLLSSPSYFPHSSHHFSSNNVLFRQCPNIKIRSGPFTDTDFKDCNDAFAISYPVFTASVLGL